MVVSASLTAGSSVSVETGVGLDVGVKVGETFVAVADGAGSGVDVAIGVRETPEISGFKGLGLAGGDCKATT